MTFRLSLCLTLLLSAAACKGPSLNAFEKDISIRGGAWAMENRPSVEFDVTDTVAAYNVSVVCRHTDGYAYKNLWLLISTRRPGDSMFRKDRFELTLQKNDGSWYGTGMDDIWDQRIPLYPTLHFNRIGTYTVVFEQNMRDNPLKGILDIGLRVEKMP